MPPPQRLVPGRVVPRVPGRKKREARGAGAAVPPGQRYDCKTPLLGEVPRGRTGALGEVPRGRTGSLNGPRLFAPLGRLSGELSVRGVAPHGADPVGPCFLLVRSHCRAGKSEEAPFCHGVVDSSQSVPLQFRGGDEPPAREVGHQNSRVGGALDSVELASSSVVTPQLFNLDSPPGPPSKNAVRPQPRQRGGDGAPSRGDLGAADGGRQRGGGDARGPVAKGSSRDGGL
mmetsp:Transcript_13145/g.43898  ORF Transcript_13145/g.43898 Transcript_13145/m.43898 type:complete len:230 (+) Transcript_13145:484-1173(+)